MPGSWEANEGPKGSHHPKIQVETLGKETEDPHFLDNLHFLSQPKIE